MPDSSPAKSQFVQLREALDDGHLAPVRRTLSSLHPSEIGRLLESLPINERKLVWEVVDAEDQGEVLIHVADEVSQDLIREMSDEDIVAATEGLEIDDLADLLEELPSRLTQLVLESMDQQDRQRLENVRQYDPETAGGLMNTDTVTVRPDVSVDVVMRYLRLRPDGLPLHTNALYVVDRYGNYLGQVLLERLLTVSTDLPISEIMDRDLAAFIVDEDDAAVAKRFQDFDLMSAPVVSEDHLLVGRITVDDVVDVIREDAEHNLMSMAGLDEEEDLFAPIKRSVRRRAVWLGVNLLTAFIAASVVGMFQATIDQIVALAVLMPVVASMGGIGGSQTLTLMIRGLALDQVSSSNALSLLKKEIMVAGINGFVWAIVVGAITIAWFNSTTLGLVIAIAMFLNQLCAACAGVALPLLLKRLDIDPALAGSVVLTTITDVIGFFAFLGLAGVMLL